MVLYIIVIIYKMDLFSPVITICILSLMFLIYLNIYYDVTCQRIFEKEDFIESEESAEDDDDGGKNYNLAL